MSNAGNTKPTWTELKAQGIRRCCAMFKGGKQCRCRATVGDAQTPNLLSWCDKHGGTMQRVVSDATETL